MAKRIGHHRFAAQMTTPNLPQPPAGGLPPIPHGFVICPQVVAAAQPWQLALYRQAYEQAQAAVSIPRHHRLLFSVWN
jgi:hypothetical protein